MSIKLPIFLLSAMLFVIAGCAPSNVMIPSPLKSNEVGGKKCGVLLVPGSPMVSSSETDIQALGIGELTQLYHDLFCQLFSRCLSEESVFGQVTILNDTISVAQQSLPYTDDNTVQLDVPQTGSLDQPLDYLLVIQRYGVNQTYSTAPSTSYPPGSYKPTARDQLPLSNAPVVTGLQLNHRLWFLYYDLKKKTPVAYGAVEYIDRNNGTRKSDWIEAIQKIAEGVVKNTPFARRK